MEKSKCSQLSEEQVKLLTHLDDRAKSLTSFAESSIASGICSTLKRDIGRSQYLRQRLLQSMEQQDLRKSLRILSLLSGVENSILLTLEKERDLRIGELLKTKK